MLYIVVWERFQLTTHHTEETSVAFCPSQMSWIEATKHHILIMSGRKIHDVGVVRQLCLFQMNEQTCLGVTWLLSVIEDLFSRQTSIRLLSIIYNGEAADYGYINKLCLRRGDVKINCATVKGLEISQFTNIQRHEETWISM